LNIDKIDTKLIDIAEATTFKPIAMRICNMVSSSKTSLDEIENSLSMDLVLSAKTLQVANSPFFSRGRKTDTLSHALALIGFDALRVIVLSAAIHDIYRNSLDVDKNLWGHSLGVSLTASLLAKQTGLADEAIAAAAGLFHDAGKLLMRGAYPQKYSEMIETIEGSALTFCEAENRLFNVNHTIAGSLLAKKWNLPQEYASVIACHHGNRSNMPLSKREQALCLMISIADDIAFFFGIGLKRKIDIFKIPYQGLGITDKDFKTLVWKVNDIYEEYVNSLSF
jgi:putative nucleotidyltransferase with HDIG domain